MPKVTKVDRPWVKKYDQNEHHDPFYNSMPWRRLRAFVLGEDPLCYYCQKVPNLIPRMATIGDHFKPRKLFPELSLVKENVKGCCQRHHDQKRAWEKTIGSREMFEHKIGEFIDKLTA